MMKYGVAFIFIFGMPALAAKIPCKIKLPSIQNGCQGEGCSMVASLVLNQDQDLVRDLQSKTVIKNLKKGLKIKGPFSFAIEVKRSGIYRAIEKAIPVEGKSTKLASGVAFEVMADRGVGTFDVCIDSEVVSVALNEDAEMLEPIKADDWIKVKLDATTTGYLKRNEVKVISSE